MRYMTECGKLKTQNKYKSKSAFIEETSEDDRVMWKLVTQTIGEDGNEKTNVKSYGSSYQAEIAKAKFFK